MENPRENPRENTPQGKRLPPLPFTSALTKSEAIAVLGYIPLHILLLPVAFTALMQRGVVDGMGANLGLYILGLLYMLGFGWRFLRRDFDALCDRPMQVMAEIIGSYGVMLCCNMLFSFAASALLENTNPNNDAIAALIDENYGAAAAMTIYMAPIVEELMFRAGIFGVLRRYNRIAAYVVSVLSFSFFHVWGFALEDPVYWIYLVQYIPVSYLLCRCYESTNSIWTPIFFHMLVNGVSVKMLSIAQELL